MNEPSIWWHFDRALDRRQYVQRLLDGYRRTPTCAGRVRREDRRLAHRLYGERNFLDLARDTAWNVWEEKQGKEVNSLCCGFSGRAYGLLSFYKHSGEEQWLARAWDLADRSIDSVRQWCEARNSLYKGEIGVAVLASDLERPEGAAMPFFEEEGWPAPGEPAPLATPEGR